MLCMCVYAWDIINDITTGIEDWIPFIRKINVSTRLSKKKEFSSSFKANYFFLLKCSIKVKTKSFSIKTYYSKQQIFNRKGNFIFHPSSFFLHPWSFFIHPSFNSRPLSFSFSFWDMVHGVNVSPLFRMCLIYKLHTEFDLTV